MSNPNHPLWPILHIAVVGTVLTAVLHFGYAGGWDPRDLLPVISAAGVMGAREWQQRRKCQLCPRCQASLQGEQEAEQDANDETPSEPTEG